MALPFTIPGQHFLPVIMALGHRIRPLNDLEAAKGAMGADQAEQSVIELLDLPFELVEPVQQAVMNADAVLAMPLLAGGNDFGGGSGIGGAGIV